MDTLTAKQRSYCMSRVKGKDTGLERVVRSELHKRGLRFRKHVKGLPGKPDIVFVSARVVVFLDGDFWHGYRFPQWAGKIPKFWQEKIGKTLVRELDGGEVVVGGRAPENLGSCWRAAG